MSPDWHPAASLSLLRHRARMLADIRRFFAACQVLEVETPLLCQAGVTDPHLHAFTTGYRKPGSPHTSTLYLQTSPEYAMKRLLAAGYGSIYQISKAFRNEESGRQHNPEFSLLEWYRVGFDLAALIGEIDALINSLFEDQPALAASERYEYTELFERYIGVDPLTADLDGLRVAADRLGLAEAASVCGDSRANWLDYLFSLKIQPQLGQGRLSFVQGYPACLPSLARTRPADARIVERVEVFLDGMELGNGYHELADPVEQQARFDAGLRERQRLGLPLPDRDERLLAALRHGLPDCSGVAIGLDRLLMARLGLPSLEAVLCFPLQRA
jgi:lysyl-tRNA synthetase class 2